MQTFPNKTPQTASNHSSVIGSLNTLFIRNDSAARKYKLAAEQANDEGLSAFFNDLSAFRKSLAEELHPLVQDMPPSPMPVTKSTKSYIEQHWDQLITALEHDNLSKVSEFCRSSEEALIMEYKKALEQDGIPVQIHEVFEKQSEKLMALKRKVERMDTVPNLKNMNIHEL
jgi:uncharacterized protein (TIGR02284 family)